MMSSPNDMNNACLAWTKVLVGIFFTFCTSMVVVGLQGVLPTFDDCGVWDANRTASGRTESNTALNNMFTLATSTINLSSLFVGFYISRLGPRITCATGGIIIAIGAVLFAFASQLQVDALWTVGYVIMACGGPFVCFSMFTLPPLVGAHRQALVFSLVIGSLDASALIMYVLNVIHEQTGACEKDLFLGFAVVPLLLIPLSMWLFPGASAHDDPPRLSSVDSTNSALLTNGGGSHDAAALASGDDYTEIIGDRTTDVPDNSKKAVDDASHLMGLMGPWVKGEEASTASILVSPQFALAILWAGMFVTSKYYYMENVDGQLAWITDNNADRVNMGVKAFSIMVPAAGLFTPVTAYLLDKGGIVFALSLMGVIQLFVGILSVIPSYEVQYATMILLVFNRFFFFAAAPIVLTKLWGSRGINELYGIQLFLAAVMNLSNFLWTYVTAHGTDGSFLALNLILNTTTFVVAMVFAYKVRAWRDARLALPSIAHVSYA